MTKINKDIVLGTAMWGWNVAQKDAWAVLDQFAENGFYFVDTASNYPIDNISNHFGLAIDWLKQWTHSNPNVLKVMVKIGALDNSGSCANNLTPNYLKSETERLKNMFGESLWGVTIHWDKRNDFESIKGTVDILNDFKSQGLQIGLSGITHPNLYLEAGLLTDSPIYAQVKENFLSSQGRKSYNCFAKNVKFWCYGINHAGYSMNKKLNTFNLRQTKYSQLELDKIDFIFQSIKNSEFSSVFNSSFEVCFCNALGNKDLHGIILGIRNLEQFKSILGTISNSNKINLASSIHNFISKIK